MATPVDVLKTGLAKVHESEEFSDCKIICGPYHFNVHKVILGTQSDYFKTAFKRGTFKEGESGTIELKATQSDAEASDETDDACDDPEIVKLMIEYFYHLDYLRGIDLTPDMNTKADGNESTVIDSWAVHIARRRTAKKQALANDTADVPDSPTTVTLPRVYLTEHAKVFAMAVKYQVDGLRDLAVAKFKEAVETQWIHDDFSHTIFLVYNTTADDVYQLRHIVADTLHERLDELKDKEEVEVIVRSIPGLAYDLMKRSREMAVFCLNGHDAGAVTKRCPTCRYLLRSCKTCKQQGYTTTCPKCSNYS